MVDMRNFILTDLIQSVCTGLKHLYQLTKNSMEERDRDNFSYLHSMGKWQYPENVGWRNKNRRREEKKGDTQMRRGEKTKNSLCRKRRLIMMLPSAAHS